MEKSNSNTNILIKNNDCTIEIIDGTLVCHNTILEKPQKKEVQK